MAETFDLFIRNARIVDGTGNPSYPAHIAISQGRIVKIARRLDPGGAKKIIDADGLNVLAQTDWYGTLAGKCVITPHPGELSRLLRKPITQIQSERRSSASIWTTSVTSWKIITCPLATPPASFRM